MTTIPNIDQELNLQHVGHVPNVLQRTYGAVFWVLTSDEITDANNMLDGCVFE
jgi:hypothetical protein